MWVKYIDLVSLNTAPAVNYNTASFLVTTPLVTTLTSDALPPQTVPSSETAAYDSDDDDALLAAAAIELGHRQLDVRSNVCRHTMHVLARDAVCLLCAATPYMFLQEMPCACCVPRPHITELSQQECTPSYCLGPVPIQRTCVALHAHPDPCNVAFWMVV